MNIVGANMDLAHDLNWYCDNCNHDFEYEEDFIFCPCCGNVLKNNQYQMDLESIEKFFEESRKTICEDCGEEFDKSFNFCPLCSKELKKINYPITIEKDNSITTDWNGEKVRIFDKNMYLSSPLAARTVINCFKWKDHLDDELEYDFKKLDLEPPQKLSFEEIYSILDVGIGIIILDRKFMLTYDEDEDDTPRKIDKIKELDYYIKVIKVRPDLYVKLVLMSDGICY